MMTQTEAIASDGVRDVSKTSAPHFLKYSESELGSYRLSLSAGKQIKVLSWQKLGLTSGRTYGRAVGISSRQSHVHTCITGSCHWWSGNSTKLWGKAGQAATAWTAMGLCGNSPCWGRNIGVWEHVKRGAVSYLEKKLIKYPLHGIKCIVL